MTDVEVKPKREYVEELEEKIKRLSETAWENRINLSDVRIWLSQFNESDVTEEDERLHALFLLSHFIYFGQAEVRQLLRSLFRDLFKSPIVHDLRRRSGNTCDVNLLKGKFGDVLHRTRFLGVGNPSESGVHLLYYFRQENNLPKTLFINSHEIFKREAVSGGYRQVVRDPDVEFYVFIDDLCGSGTQAREYSVDLVEPVKRERPDVKVYYFVLFATTGGLRAVRDLGCFDKVGAVFELDETFKTLDASSRIFSPEEAPFLRERVRATCMKHGARLWPPHPLGYKDGQLLMGFSHNTPDNTLPIFWWDGEVGQPWTPIFRRYHKDYGW